MATWDVFHGDRLELERGLTADGIREALARGEMHDDDLIRPSGTTVAWVRLAEMPQILQPEGPLADPDATVFSKTVAQPPVFSKTVAQPPLPSQKSITPPSVPSKSVSPAPHAKTVAPPSTPSSRTATPLPKPKAPISRAEPSDYEIQVEDSGRVPTVPSAKTLEPPDWFRLKDESDDVAFPVMNDLIVESKSIPESPATSQVSPPGGWVWANDDESDSEEFDDDFADESKSPRSDRGHHTRREILDDDDDDDNGDKGGVAGAALALTPRAAADTQKLSSTSRLALPVVSANERGAAGVGGLVEVAADEEFSLTRSGPMTVEELDLAPMVDVAFQLVLFFMVAAQTVLYKTLEIPKPSAEQAPSAVAQGRSRSLDELKEDYILVEIDASGAMKIDREPIAADRNVLVERLRSARETTRRKAMLISAEYATAHRNTVMAYDAANEIGLGIVIAKPTPPQGPAPSPLLRQAPAPAAGKPAAG